MTPPLANLFALPSPLPAVEETEILAVGKGVRIERILSTGQTTPVGEWYDQEEDEWVTLLQGEAALRFTEGELYHLKSGDHLLIPAHCRHRVEYMSENPPCVWIAVHGRLQASP
ncbi:MAG: cupin domain-containing protein [Thermosynechococcaceae cyanobacterium MS004]|nr:cupin domain-containing protein [Thermosynechococcaceae cyanobacterium MS004]